MCYKGAPSIGKKTMISRGSRAPWRRSGGFSGSAGPGFDEHIIRADEKRDLLGGRVLAHRKGRDLQCRRSSEPARDVGRDGEHRRGRRHHRDHLAARLVERASPDPQRRLQCEHQGGGRGGRHGRAHRDLPQGRHGRPVPVLSRRQDRFLGHGERVERGRQQLSAGERHRLDGRASSPATSTPPWRWPRITMRVRTEPIMHPACLRRCTAISTGWDTRSRTSPLPAPPAWKGCSRRTSINTASSAT